MSHLNTASAVDERRSTTDFDAVVLAAPYQFTGIDVTSPSISVPDEIPYVKLHVTVFTSPHLLSPRFFGLQKGSLIPQYVLTTIPKDESPGKGPKSAGSPGFFSISVHRTVMNPATKQREYQYKIFSPSPPNDTFLSNLLDVELRSDHLEPQDEVEAGSRISGRDITWIYRKEWNSYPYEYPRVTFERVELDENLWYTSGMDSFISTMEINALMGMNVARLVVDKALGERSGAASNNDRGSHKHDISSAPGL